MQKNFEGSEGLQSDDKQSILNHFLESSKLELKDVDVEDFELKIQSINEVLTLLNFINSETLSKDQMKVFNVLINNLCFDGNQSFAENIVGNYDKLFEDNFFMLVSFANKIQIQRKNVKPETLYKYARKLMESSYNNVEARERIFHIIDESKTVLDNNLAQTTQNQSAPYLSQQNIIQMEALSPLKFIKATESVGSMVVNNHGLLDKEVFLRSNSRTDFSPHPDFSPMTLQDMGKSESKELFVPHNWQQKEFKRIYTRDPITNQELKSVQVKILGVNQNFYNVYYLTNEGNVLSVCLNMHETGKMMEDALDMWQSISEYLDTCAKQYSQDQLASDTESNPDESEFSKIKEPAQMLEWLLNRFENLELNMDKSLIYSWTDIQRVLKINESIIFPELYKTILWQVKSLKFYQDQNNKENRDLVRIMASNDHDKFYKICSILEDGHIPSGDRVNNSHQYGITQAIQRENFIANKQLNNHAKPILLMSSNREDDFQSFFLDINLLDNNGYMPKIKGQNLPDYSKELSESIKDCYIQGGYITVNNNRVSEQEFDNFTFLAGDNILINLPI